MGGWESVSCALPFSKPAFLCIEYLIPLEQVSTEATASHRPKHVLYPIVYVYTLRVMKYLIQFLSFFVFCFLLLFFEFMGRKRNVSNQKWKRNNERVQNQKIGERFDGYIVYYKEPFFLVLSCHYHFHICRYARVHVVQNYSISYSRSVFSRVRNQDG